jgi:hypothetical protein
VVVGVSSGNKILRIDNFRIARRSSGIVELKSVDHIGLMELSLAVAPSRRFIGNACGAAPGAIAFP